MLRTTTSQTTYTVVVPRPVVTGLIQRSKIWVEHAAKHRNLRVGTGFRFTLNESGRVTFAFEQSRPGRKVHAKCVAPTARNQHKPVCRHLVVIRTLVKNGVAGLNTILFSGRIGHTWLRPGRYTVLVTATTGGRASVSKTLSFTIATG